MSDYRRANFKGGYYFFTVVTFQRMKFLTNTLSRDCLRFAFGKVKEKRPFDNVAMCLLPDHLHCVWKLPDGDSDFSTRWNSIKSLFTKTYLKSGGHEGQRNVSRMRTGEAAVWQRRFWEHQISLGGGVMTPPYLLVKSARNTSQNMINANGYLLKVDNLKTYFPIRKGLLRRTASYIKAVDGVSFGIKKGQTLGLVGESGCGKTTVARSIIRLVPATAGKVVFEQRDILSAEVLELQRFRSQISLIFQDPYGSLNPRMTIGNIIGEPLKVQRKITNNELAERVAEMLWKVGLSSDCMNRYPHEFSGGQRQRIGIARALVLEPKLVICDEPLSALDVSIQSQILNLLKDLQEEFGLTFLFIAHDLAVVEFFCDIVAVMYMGRIVEQAAARELYRNPLHPYTRALISAVPAVERPGRRRRSISGGEVPSVLNWFPQGGVPPTGCPFHPRCPRRQSDCLEQIPALKRVKNTYYGHFVACWKF